MADLPSLDDLLAPIADGGSPAGLDASQEAEYEAVREELDKQTNPNTSGIVDWHHVQSLSVDLLTHKTKDFLVGSWLAVALFENEGIEGFDLGANLLLGLVRDYWEDGHPPIKRLRGRRNAIEWWKSRSKDWLEGNDSIQILVSAEQGLLETLKSLDQALSEVDPDSLPLSELASRVRLLNTIPDPVPESETPPGEPETTSQSDQTVPEAREGEAGSVAAIDSISPSDAPPRTQGFSASPLTITQLSDVASALTPVQGYLFDISDGLRTLDPYNPLLVKLTRFAARSSILFLPPSQGKTTRIPSPQMAGYEEVIAAANPEGVLSFCESRIASAPFWLDLEMQAAHAYAAMGHQASGMRLALVDEMLSFIQRLPGVELLQFADGKPFASSETLSWIESCRNERSSGGSVDALSQVRTEANKAISDGQLDTAMDLYQSFITNSRDSRNQYRARLALVGLLMENRSDVDAMPFIEPLIEEAQKRSLHEWEPDLVFQALSYKLRALRIRIHTQEQQPTLNAVMLSALQAELEGVTKQMSSLDFAQAVRHY